MNRTEKEKIIQYLLEGKCINDPPYDCKECQYGYSKNYAWKCDHDKIIKDILETGDVTINQEIIGRAIKKYGKNMQQNVAMEECAELIQTISKKIRENENTAITKKVFNRKHLIEEMADVLICIETLKQIHKVTTEELQSEINRKQERQKRRIETKD